MKADKGKINVKAKTITEPAKYPQMYTGNQMVEYTVGTPSIEGGKIVATTALRHFQALHTAQSRQALPREFILEAGKYVVKDKSGNVVDPKYYDVTFSDNKKAGNCYYYSYRKSSVQGKRKCKLQDHKQQHFQVEL